MDDDGREEKKEALPIRRIFINHVDSYQGSNLAKYLSQCVVGATEEGLDDAGEEERGEEEEEEGEKKEFVAKEGAYEVVGTLREKSLAKPQAYIKEIVQYDTKDSLYEQLLNCDIIIYDITEDSAQIDDACWAVSQLHADLEKLSKERPKTFILISTVLTWARTKVDEEDPEIPFTEDDYRRRKPHPDFKEHVSAEKHVTKLGKTSKSKLSTYVVASGLTYGAGENIFHYLFKSAWHNVEEMLCYGDGKNVVPTIHIKDLAAVIQNIADGRPKVRYIVAVDDSKNTLAQITKAVSKSLSTGKVKKTPIADALLLKDIKQSDLNSLTVRLRMSAVYARESMNIQWVSEAGLVENMDNIVKEYKQTRGLLPVRMLIYGPPASGKTTVSTQLCEYFKLHHVNIKDVLEEAVNKMTRFIEAHKLRKVRAEAGLDGEGEGEQKELEEEEEEEDEEEDEEGKAAEYEQLLESMKESREQNGGRLDDGFIVRFMREKLLSKPCQNQGYVIDGFPRSGAGASGARQLAQDIFASEEEGENGDLKSFDKRLMPELVVCLEASDEYINSRVINLPEAAVAGTHNTQDGLVRRLREYRHANTTDETVMNYLDELENHPEKIDITVDTSIRMKDTVDKIIKLIRGGPRNYGMTEEEKEEMRRVEGEERIRREERERLERETNAAEEAALRKKRQEEWSKRLEEVKREEHELLSTQSEPLRNYLMRHVMPTLTQGLVECCKIRPDDPIDYLAEYLFKNNPQVD